MFPAASSAWKATLKVPGEKTEPLGPPSVWVIVGVPQLSVPVASTKVTVASQIPVSVLAEIFAGHEMEGASISFTVTVKEQLAVFPLASVICQVSVFVPTGKSPPLPSPEESTIESPPEPQLSLPAGVE